MEEARGAARRRRHRRREDRLMVDNIAVQPGQVGHPHARHHRVRRRARPAAGGAGDRHRARHPGVEPVVPARHAGRARLPRARRAALFGRARAAAAAGAQRRVQPRRARRAAGAHAARPAQRDHQLLHPQRVGRRGDRHRNQRAGAALCRRRPARGCRCTRSPSGKALLAALPDEELDRYFAESRAHALHRRDGDRGKGAAHARSRRSAAPASRSPTRSSRSASAASAGSSRSAASRSARCRSAIPKARFDEAMQRRAMDLLERTAGLLETA